MVLGSQRYIIVETVYRDPQVTTANMRRGASESDLGGSHKKARVQSDI